jgi:hypothetical protein
MFRQIYRRRPTHTLDHVWIRIEPSDQRYMIRPRVRIAHCVSRQEMLSSRVVLVSTVTIPECAEELVLRDAAAEPESDSGSRYLLKQENSTPLVPGEIRQLVSNLRAQIVTIATPQSENLATCGPTQAKVL